MSNKGHRVACRMISANILIHLKHLTFIARFVYFLKIYLQTRKNNDEGQFIPTGMFEKNTQIIRNG